MAKTRYRIRGRTIRCSGLSSARLVRCMAIWIYDKHPLLAKAFAACRDQMPYLWLTGWQHPDHNTLWRFYKEHRMEMRHLFKLTVRTAVNMELVDMAVQAIDGTKLQANAAKDRTYDAKGLQRLLERTDTVIEELEKQNEAGDDPPPIH